MYAATEPQVSPHAVSQFEARQTLSAETSLDVPTGLSPMHRERHPGSPLHLPRQVWYAAQAGSAAHVVDSAQQLAWRHEAHALVPYGKPQRVEVRSVGGLSVMPTS
jgi:hypothetical protein